MRIVGLGVIFAFLLSLLGAAPALAADRGHGAIFYSPSGHRIGWAKSQSDDETAAHIAQAICTGGQVDEQSLRAFQNQDAGTDVTGPPIDINVRVNDCYKVIKFDSPANHQCGGFGFVYGGNVSQGARERTRSQVESDLNRWERSFIVCNDEPATTGFERFANALSGLANALNGNANSRGNGGSTIGTNGAPASTTIVAFRNDTPEAVYYYLACQGDAKYQKYTVQPGAVQTVDTTLWGTGCSRVLFDLPSNANDGGSVEQKHTIAAGFLYPIAKLASGGYLDLREGVAMGGASNAGTQNKRIHLYNDLPIQADVVVTCPNKTPTTWHLAPNSDETHVINCDGFSMSVTAARGGDSQTRTFQATNGRAYHITANTTEGLLELKEGP